jgi:hypothetical protein
MFQRIPCVIGVGSDGVDKYKALRDVLKSYTAEAIAEEPPPVPLVCISLCTKQQFTLYTVCRLKRLVHFVLPCVRRPSTGTLPYTG